MDRYTDELEPTRKQQREQENRDCIGGMRDTARAAARIPGWRVVGSILRKAIDEFLDSRGDPLERAIRLMGSAEADGTARALGS